MGIIGNIDVREAVSIVNMTFVAMLVIGSARGGRRVSRSRGQRGHAVTCPEVKAYKLRLRSKLMKWRIFITRFTGKAHAPYAKRGVIAGAQRESRHGDGSATAVSPLRSRSDGRPLWTPVSQPRASSSPRPPPGDAAQPSRSCSPVRPASPPLCFRLFPVSRLLATRLVIRTPF